MNDFKLLKVILPYMKPYWWQVLIVILLIPISSFTFSVQPIILQRAIDGPLSEFNMDGLWIYVYLLIAAVAFNFVIQVLQFWFVNLIGQNVVYSIRQKLFEHLENLSMSFFDRTPVGRSVSRLTSDVEQLSESFAGGLVLVILDVFNILGILIFMLYLHLKMSLVVIGFLVPILIISIFYQQKFRKANLKAREELSKLNSFLQQNIVGISVVHVLNSAKKSMDKFAKNNQAYFKANDSSIKADAQLSAIIELISFVAIAALILLSARIIQDSNPETMISIGIILAFLQYAQSLFEPIRNLSDRFTIIQSAFTSAERINELLVATNDLEMKDSNADLGLAEIKAGEDIIEFRHVAFRYPTVSEEKNNLVLKDLSFKIKKGEKLAIVGRTGSGKSTIIKLLTRLYDPVGGRILLDDKDLKTYDLSKLRKQIISIHQDSYIFAGDIKDNIALNRDEETLHMDFIKPLLDLIGLEADKELSERANNISAGEEQVINFARALVTKPEFVILDEATAKIDVKTESTIQNTLKEYLQEKTAIIIAHRLETIKNCDRILVIDNGRVAEEGSHSELLEKNGIYKKLSANFSSK